MPQTNAKPWERNLRQTVKSTYGMGWSVRGRAAGTTEIGRRWSDGTRSTATVAIPWQRTQGPALLAMIERLDHLTEPVAAGGQGLSLAKAAGLTQLEETGNSAQAIRAGAVDWPAVVERYRHHRVEVTGEISKSTWHRREQRYCKNVLTLLAGPRAPKDGPSLLSALIAAHPSAPGGSGRKQRVATAARLLSFAVGKCGAPDRWLPPAERGDLVGKRQDRKQDGVPLLDDQGLAIYRAIPDPQWKLAWGLLVAFGLRPAEIDHCRPEGDCLWVDGVKRNSTGKSKPRLVHALDPAGWPGMGATMISLLAERGAAALPKKQKVAYRSGSLIQYLQRYVPEWGQLITEATAAGQGHLTPYSARHGYAFRGTTLGLDHRTLSKLMGHDPATHLAHYGRWSSDDSVAAAVATALANRQRNALIASESRALAG